MNKCDVELVYEVEGANRPGLIVIEPFAINAMRDLRQIEPDAHEAGGVLIGERRGDSLIVKEVTTPSPQDQSSRFHFVRRFFHHQFAIVNANRHTNGTSNYLGEWHTHPQDKPFPSTIDLKNWKKSLRGHEPCLVAVVGRDEEWWALYEHGKFHRLVLLTLD